VKVKEQAVWGTESGKREKLAHRKPQIQRDLGFVQVEPEGQRLPCSFRRGTLGQTPGFCDGGPQE
jgi:hypothetical protein